MVYGDPLKFAIMIEKLSCWSDRESYDNGLFHYIIDGNMIPDRASVATISGDVFCLSGENSLISFPENDEIFSLPKEEAFIFMLQSMLPGFLGSDNELPLEEGEPDYTYQASTYNIEDNGFYVFSVSSGETVKILGAKVAELFFDAEGCGEWRNVQPLNIHEVFVDKQYVKSIVERVLKEHGREGSE